jgi:hypothetical protein
VLIFLDGLFVRVRAIAASLLFVSLSDAPLRTVRGVLFFAKDARYVEDENFRRNIFILRQL